MITPVRGSRGPGGANANAPHRFPGHWHELANGRHDRCQAAGGIARGHHWYANLLHNLTFSVDQTGGNLGSANVDTQGKRLAHEVRSSDRQRARLYLRSRIRRKTIF